MKTAAFLIGVFIAAVGIAGILAPTGLVWIAGHVVNAGAFYAIALIRVTFGLTLIAAAHETRAPRTIRVLGGVIILSGVAAALFGLTGIEQARGMIAWWLRLGPAATRLAAISILALGGFISHACWPSRHPR